MIFPKDVIAMKRISAIALISVCMICMTHLTAHGAASDDWSSLSNFISRVGISREDADKIKDQIDRRSQPIVKSVTISPEHPNGDEPVTITATIVTPHKPNGEEVYEAYINYSTDGGRNMSRIDMVKETKDGNIWNGVIPGQPSGTNVIYGIQAVNAFDETYVEPLCYVENILKTFDKNVSEECKSNKNPEYCAAQRPKDCMFPMSIASGALDPNSEDTNRIPAPPELFIKTTRVGYNEKTLFLEIDTKDNVSPGSYSPMNVNVYVAGWLNPDRSGSETGIDGILRKGAVVIYAPLNPTNKCALFNLRDAVAVQSDTQSVTCTPKENQLIFSIDRKAIEPNPSKTLEFIFMTTNMQQISPPDIDLQDITLFTRATVANRNYAVK
jgi:hypothetical protein